jgi:hypothetical protein
MKSKFAIFAFLLLLIPTLAMANWDVEFVWQANPAQDLSHYVLLQDGADVSGQITAETFTVPNLPVGSYDFVLRAVDILGNYADTSALTLVLDELPPGVTEGFMVQSFTKVSP